MKRIAINLFLCLFLLTVCEVLPAQSKADVMLKRRFAKQLNDPHLPDLLKRIFLDQEWRLAEANSEQPLRSLLSIFDSLSSTNKNIRLFYMIIAGNSAKHADGFYSEGLGYASKEYVDTDLGEFVDCFIGKTALSDKQLETWAGLVLGEVQLLSSSGDTTQFGKTISGYKKNSNNFNKKEKKVLDKFIAIMKKEWEIVNPNK